MQVCVKIGRDWRIEADGYGDVTEEVALALAKMNADEHAQLQLHALDRQRRIAATYGQEARTMSFGHQVAQIDTGIFNYWRAREGAGFWSDPKSLEAFLKKHPECRVVAKSQKVMVGGGLSRASAGKGRWAK